jgi:lipopolysaccharide export system protein LptA
MPSGRLKCERPGRFLKAILIFILIVLNQAVYAQQKKRIYIEHADSLTQSDFVPDAWRLLGNVILEHNQAYMYCDSAYAYTTNNNVDAFGRVHINQGDTIHLWADKIHYFGDNRLARSIGNVRLESRNATLYTDTLDFDLSRNIGFYEHNGKIVDSTNTLTSIIGRYFVDEDLAYFYQDVKGLSDKNEFYSDSVKYNVKTGLISLISQTTIKDSANILYARDGWYDSKTGETYLKSDPVVFNDNQQLKANTIRYSREKGIGKAVGAVDIYDLKNKMIVRGEVADYNDIAKTAVVSDSIVLILFDERDSLFLHADSLKTIPDTIGDEKIVKAYWGVRFWRENIQGVCDSLAYFTRDSTVQLFRNPILWSENRQLSADYVEMKSNTGKPDELRLRNNSFIISKHDSLMFDQIKGKNMVGFIIENELSNIEVDGNGQTLYYAEDKEDIIGLNRAESSKINIGFDKGKIKRISLISEPAGTLKPLFNLNEMDRKLPGFIWMEEIRPKSKEDIFQK